MRDDTGARHILAHRRDRLRPEFQWLEVELKTGGLYLYREVPARIHQAFMAALSKGSFYNRWVRDDYPFVRVR
jgi:hypothetical protein